MPDRSSTADYISALSLELAKLAGHAQLPVLAYLLDMAALEAARVNSPAKPRPRGGQSGKRE
jgi:hypothetical protein